VERSDRHQKYIPTGTPDRPPEAGGLYDCSAASAPPIPEPRQLFENGDGGMKATTIEESRRLVSQPVSRNSARMFWYLIRQDAARRSLKWSIPIALVIGLLLRMVAGADVYDWDRLPFYKHHGEISYALVEVWLALLFAIIVAHFNSRCSSMSLGLPISPRRLWLIRIVAIASAGVLPFVTIILSVSLFSRGNIVDLAMMGIAARVTAGIVLSAVLFQVPDPGLYRIRGTRSFKWYVAAVTVCVLFYVMVTPKSWIYTLLPLVAAVVVVCLLYIRLPRVFKTANAERGEVTPSSSPPKTGEDHLTERWRMSSSAGRTWRLIRIILRETVNSWSGWLTILLIAVTVWGLLAQYYAAFHSLNDYLILMLWIGLLMMRSMKGLARLDSYPLPRRLVFLVVLGVVAGAIGAGLTFGYVLHHSSGDPVTQVRGHNGKLRVPFEAWEIAWDGQPSEVVAPWGESSRPEGMYLFNAGTGICAYNPFEITKHSSPEFVAYQVDRAVERVHGIRAEIADKTGAPLDSSFVNNFKDEKYTIETSLFQKSELRLRTQAMIFTGWEILFALLVGVWWRRFRPAADILRTRWFVILFFSVPYTVLFGLMVLSTRGVISADAVLAMTMIALRSLAEWIPLGTGLLWTITALIGLASLWYVQRCYVEAEAPLQRGGKSLLSEY